MLLYVALLCIATSHKEQANIQLKQKQFLTYQDAPSVAQKITEDILHKTYTVKGAITYI